MNQIRPFIGSEVYNPCMTLRSAQKVFDQFITGENSDDRNKFEELLTSHPEIASDLRKLYERHRAAERAVEHALPDPLGLAGEETFFGGRSRSHYRPTPRIQPGQQLGDFKLIRPLGSGGMGEVWEAYQVSLDRKVALKLIRPDRVTRKSLEYFSREARAAGRLRHESIVDVFAHGSDDDIAWIAMELVEGSWTLRDFLDEVSSTQETPESYHKDVARLVAQLADALQTAHDQGVIHRDLKPQNILISDENNPKLMDFGLARLMDETALSITGELAGTYNYMSPEQVAAKRPGIDHRTDIFSLGVVLYELLALRLPFEGDTSHQIANQIMFKDPPELNSIRSRVPRDLAVITGKCIEKDRDRRYGTAREVAAELRRFLAHEPILARPPGTIVRVQKWARRNPAEASAIAVAMVASLVIGWLGLFAMEKADALDLTNQVLAAETSALKRLSARQDLDDLVLSQLDLWPPHPERLQDLREWETKARLLLAELPEHQVTLESLQQKALDATPAELKSDRETHPDLPRLNRLQDRIGCLERALARRRDGTPYREVEPDWESLPADCAGLSSLSWELVRPYRQQFGRESEGLAIARRALEIAEAEGLPSRIAGIHDTISKAYFALGYDDEALVASQRALEAAPEDKRASYEKFVEDLEGWIAELSGPEGIANAEREIGSLELLREELAQTVNSRRTFHFPDTVEGQQDRWWHSRLISLIGDLESLTEEGSGLLSDEENATAATHGWSVPRRIQFAEMLRESSSEEGSWSRRWQEAASAIAAHEDYDGLALQPQDGLVPIGPDPASGLWEFWDVASGSEPNRDADGHVQPSVESGMTFVLIPGGSFLMGAQGTDSSAPHFDSQAREDEQPVRRVEMGPFFLSKFETTQEQWRRLSGQSPSFMTQGLNPALHPVERISWTTSLRVLSRLGLTLPSEAQWEYACRAGSDSRWWTGNERETLEQQKAVNLADAAAARTGAKWSGIAEWPEFDDGYAAHAPVGSFAANPFGLHDVHGNVSEWCLDGYSPRFYANSAEENPLAPPESSASRVNRGGSFFVGPSFTRSSARKSVPPTNAGVDLGVRPARRIQD